MDNELVTIFIPVFNGEKYLRNTLQSVANQSYSAIEVLLVDDSSTDASWNILQEFAANDSRFKLLQKPNGGMVAKSWNYILPKVKGEFVFYMSQDDLLSEDLMEKMCARQIETKASIVVPDLEFYYENNVNNKRIAGFYNDRTAIISGRLAFLESLPWNIHGFFLLQKQLIQDEFFPEDAFDSDEYVTRKLFLKSEKVVFSEGIFYYRQDNPNAITKKKDVTRFYQLNTHLKILDLIEKNNFDKLLVQQKKYELIHQFMEQKIQFSYFKFEKDAQKKEVASFLNFFSTNFTPSFFKDTFHFKSSTRSIKFIFVRLIYKKEVFLKLVGKLRNNKNR